MKDLTTALLFVGVIALAYYAIDALTTNSPSRRNRDVTDMKIIGTGLNVLRTI